MSVVTVASSIIGGVVFVAAGLVVSVTAKRLFFPAWRGCLAVTTVALLWLCWALGLGQLLGAVGLVRRMALLTTAVLSAGAAVGLRRRAERPGQGQTVLPAPSVAAKQTGGLADHAITVATVMLVLLVAAIWIARTAIAVHRGINDVDSLGYHLPFIVTFAHSGYADQHRILIPLLPVQFFPGNDELLAAMALAITQSLAFAAIKNLIFGALVLVSAYALGETFGAARLAVAATAIALGFPIVAFSQPGEAINDTLLLLLFVGGLAVLANARDRPAPYVLTMACAGLAIGIKASGIVPATGLAVLAVALLMARVPSHRWRWTGAGLLAAAALGGSWYLRNFIDYGNPEPPIGIGIGPFHLKAIHGVDAAIGYSVAHYAFHGRLLGVFARGLFRGLGPLFIVTAALCLLGIVAAYQSRDRFLLGLSIVAVVSFLGYLVTPAGAFGAPGAVPESFVINLHYAIPALLAGALGGAIALARWHWAWTLPAVGVVAVASGISRGRGISVWAPEIGGPGFALLLAAAGVGTMVSLVWWHPSLGRLKRPLAVAGSALALVAVPVIADRYPLRRSTDPVANWAASVHDAHIAAWNANVGDLYGRQAQNQVAILSRLLEGAAVPIDTCPTWMRALRDGHFQYTAVIGTSAWSRWLGADPAFRLVADELVGATRDELNTARRFDTKVFQIVGTPDVGCPGQVDTGADFWRATLAGG